jgi:hypothetical protein
MKKLNGIVEVLEKASENIGEFIGLARLEASPNLKRRCSTVPTIPSGWFGDSSHVPTEELRFKVDVFVAETEDDQELQELSKLVQRISLG